MSEEIQQACEKLIATVKAIPPEDQKRREEERVRYEAEMRSNKVRALRAVWNAPVRHLKQDVQFFGEWSVKLNAITKSLGHGFVIALTGVRGNGKSQLGVELMRRATDKLMPSLFTSAVEFFIALKQTYRQDSKLNEGDVLKLYRVPKLLVIDEVGKRSESDWENTMLFELLNKRYEDMSDTLLIDNRSKAEFVQMIGPSLASRMNETGGIIECSWPSFRT